MSPPPTDTRTLAVKATDTDSAIDAAIDHIAADTTLGEEAWWDVRYEGDREMVLRVCDDAGRVTDWTVTW